MLSFSIPPWNIWIISFMSEIKQREKHITFWWFLKYVSFSQEMNCLSACSALVPVLLKRSQCIIHARRPLMSITVSERDVPVAVNMTLQSNATRPVYQQINQNEVGLIRAWLFFLSDTKKYRIPLPCIKVGKIEDVWRDAALH